MIQPTLTPEPHLANVCTLLGFSLNIISSLNFSMTLLSKYRYFLIIYGIYHHLNTYHSVLSCVFLEGYKLPQKKCHKFSFICPPTKPFLKHSRSLIYIQGRGGNQAAREQRKEGGREDKVSVTLSLLDEDTER